MVPSPHCKQRLPASSGCPPLCFTHARYAGHFESGATATLQAVAASVPGATLERAKLLWHSGHENRALAELQAARR
eukprot:scaffold145093_cov18-Tisochrysis_lutea.AAC.1